MLGFCVAHWVICNVGYTRKQSAGVPFQRYVSALKPDTARRVETMIEIILLRSGLLHLPGFMVLRKDYDCMLDEIVRPIVDFIVLFIYIFICILGLYPCVLCIRS